MSRLGNRTIIIPKNILIKLKKNVISVTGPLGTISMKIIGELKIEIEENKLTIQRIENNKYNKSLHGLYRMLINNMIIGVFYGFKKELELKGVGYKVALDKEKKVLEFHLGYSHNIVMNLPKELKVEIKNEKNQNTMIIFRSYDKQLLGIFAAKIRSLRKPDPYKGKGIRYINEYILKKAGKTTVK
ncbi:50S ribosomal protein L6 [Candidatus Karelsulcia muelleri]|uniref:50S ribosomal protein L6 n=1 Tax=Candidatus Karelsulcia muelleri TaxID=336810 RepID=A0A346E0Z7_9FLAO|nr:50S ribosomal protein L6 [Candidatus Karelsulcia muelleri]AXN02652.1 LSU ribosomal protein L6p (L9e) [Candidatus Karelsulcia muelleri]WDI79584.1 50S ribosomal protein L6 [Candidatus Karelsulcia muelleri]WDR78906.1 50S ribosomal protein L6 [Candidatus Karelsulcia muelleri]